MQRMIYADNAATTRLSPAVLEAMTPYLCEAYGNPSSLYALGAQAKQAVEQARESVARALGAQAGEICFTSGGSEADNWAINGMAAQLRRSGKTHVITTAFEHHAVLHPLARLEREGFEITYLDVHADGVVRPDELEAALRPDTGLVTIMYANNEIGTIQPVAQIGAICRKHGVVFHTDAVQAAGSLPIDVAAQQIDLLSLSAHKFHGPKGVGALYIRRGLRLDSLIDGGAQENGRRAGTENVAGIVGLRTALEQAVATMDVRAAKLMRLREHVIRGAMQIERARLNGHPTKRLPGNVNLCFEGIEGESLLLLLDLKGVCASSGSACTSGSLDPSHVLLSLGLPHEIAHGSLRLTFSDENTMEDADYIVSVLPDIVSRLREMSPLWERIKREERND